MKRLKQIILMSSNASRNIIYRTDKLFVIGTLFFSCVLFIQTIKGLSADDSASDEQLLRQYIQSKGSSIIFLKADTPDGWRYARSCMEGPVFNATQVWWD